MDPKKVKWEVKNFFQKRFLVEDLDRPKLDGTRLKQISQQQYESFIARFEEDEVKEAIWECGSSQSPNLDGFNFHFIKAF